jgi:hypothetical protein
VKALALAALLALCVLGCTEVEIRVCGEACARSYRAMVKYSTADGCICGDPVKPVAVPQ